MKTKRLLSGVMSVVMIFTMFFAMTLVDSERGYDHRKSHIHREQY